MHAKQAQEALRFLFTNNYPVMLTGAPGTAKTALIEGIASEIDYEVIHAFLVSSDPTDFKGLPFAGKDGEQANFLPYGDLYRLIHATAPLIYFMDDFGQASPAVQAAAMQPVLARRFNGHKISDHVRFAAATNRKADRAGVSGILEPVKSRFTIIPLEVSADEWCEWALANGLPAELVAFTKFRPELLHKFEPQPEIKNYPCPRTVEKIGRMQNQGLPESIRFDVFSGTAGEGYAMEYTDFLKIYNSLPDVDLMIQHPDDPVNITEPSVLYALAGALTARATEDSFANIIKVLSHLPGEISVLTMKMILAKDKKLVNNPAFSAWVSRNKDILL